MKTILVSMALVCAFLGGACSRSEEEQAAKATPVPNLKSDAERLQQATAKAAEERKRAAEASATATPAQN
jgi:Na+-transporting methylmalonyl-CoA/oxaloacetate decarboxylase gamma subunit